MSDFGHFNELDKMLKLKSLLLNLLTEDDTLILGGDNHYPVGTRTLRDLDNLKALFKNLPGSICGVLGNHDYHGDISLNIRSH